MTFRGFYPCLIAALLFARSGFAAPLPTTKPEQAGFSSARLETFHRDLDQFVDRGTYPNYIVLLARDGKIFDWRVHGWQDIEARKPMRQDTIVRIYSMSKIITSVAVLTLLEDGKLRLADPVEKFLPELKNRQVLKGGTADAPILEPANRPITVRDLLTHTAGYYYPETWSAEPVAAELMQRVKPFEATDLDDFVRRIAPLPLCDQPGTRFRYGIAIDLLGLIVQRVSGQRFDQYLEQRLFRPLGMTDTAFWVPAEKRERLATLYGHDAAGKLTPVPMGWKEPTASEGWLSGGGGLFSTAADYARFAQMLLNGGTLDGTRILSRKTVELMTQNHISQIADPHPFNRKELGFGLGVRMVTNLGESFTSGSPGMFGWDGAASTLVWMDPKERLVALLLTQNMPFNQDDIHAHFTTGVYSALEK